MTTADRAPPLLTAPDLTRFAGETRRFLRVCGVDAGTAEDLCQDALLLAVRKQVRFDDLRAARSWLRQAARFLMLEHGRRRRRRPVEVDAEWLDAVERHFARLPDDDAWTDAVRSCVDACTDAPHARCGSSTASSTPTPRPPRRSA